MLALGPDRPQLSNAPRRSSGRAAICVNAPVADGRDDNQRSERHGRLLSSPGGPRVDAARGNRRVADAVAPPSAAAAVTAACEALAQRARCRPKQRPTRRCATSKQQPAEEVRRASSGRRNGRHADRRASALLAKGPVICPPERAPRRGLLSDKPGHATLPRPACRLFAQDDAGVSVVANPIARRYDGGRQKRSCGARQRDRRDRAMATPGLGRRIVAREKSGRS